MWVCLIDWGLFILYINEMPVGSEVIIQVYRGKEKVELASEVVDMDMQLRGVLSKKARFIPIKLIEEDGKVVSFPENLHYHTIITHGSSPLIWYEMSIRCIQHPTTGQKWHIIWRKKRERYTIVERTIDFIWGAVVLLR